MAIRLKGRADGPDLRVFRLWDLATYGVAAIIATILMALATGTGQTAEGAPVEAWRLAAGWGVAAMFWAAFATVLFWRWRFVEKIDYVIEAYGIAVVTNGQPVDRLGIQAELARTVAVWGQVPGISKEDVLDALDGTFVVFKDYPFEMHRRKGLLAGLALPTRNQVWVGYRSPLALSALAHELGHIILHRTGRDAGEQSLKDHADAYGVPY